MAPRSTGENMAGSFGGVGMAAAVGGAKGTAGGMMMTNMAAMAGLESLEVDEKTADEIINNVEKMIKAEKTKDTAAKRDKKADAKIIDLTDAAAGKVGAASASDSKTGGGSASKPKPGQAAAAG